ncbi:Alanyl-tRNA editing protein AlaX-S (AlaX-S) (Alanyl-tRNA deacylase AlaX-S) (PhoAlaX) [Durusdinium trenchii]|uniref:Alanyl-tRNA editing protein AlaX-S (AlaX-S) (Alanyl-tRNA deacylase AlaX-S) (PhoAlaX) n=1 Tax=Durusdinium trenchii TaxID=1381693 RepID=A0ABP0MYG8_9DINO
MCADADGAGPVNGAGAAGAAVRGSSPGPVLRAPSPEPSVTTAESPYFAAALAVIKGAAAQALDIPLARTTEAVKPYDDLCGRITLNSVPSFPSKPQRTRFERLVAEKVAEDAAFRVFSMPKAIAQDLYGDFCDFTDESPDQLQFLSLSDWSLSVIEHPVLKSTALLGRVELTAFKHRNEKGHFEVSFKIHPPGAEPALAEASDAPLPTLAELLPTGRD